MQMSDERATIFLQPVSCKNPRNNYDIWYCNLKWKWNENFFLSAEQQQLIKGVSGPLAAASRLQQQEPQNLCEEGGHPGHLNSSFKKLNPWTELFLIFLMSKHLLMEKKNLPQFNKTIFLT